MEYLRALQHQRLTSYATLTEWTVNGIRFLPFLPRE